MLSTDKNLYTIRFTDFLKQPLSTGAIGSYGNHSIHNALQHIDRKQTHNILEIGPATGATTAYIMKHRSPQSSFVCCEINADFCETLTARFGASLPIYHMDFLAWTPSKEQYDLIVSGVPMSLLSKETQYAMLQKTYNLLAPGGTYVHILYSHALANTVEAFFGNVDYNYCLFDFPFTCAIRATKN